MNDNVKRLHPDLVTAGDVIDSLREDLDKIEELYAVAIIDGKPVFYISGNVKGGVYAAAALQDQLLMYSKGEIE